jgi:TniQ
MAPLPLSDELISSWLLRVAAANSVSLADLLSGCEAHHPVAFRELLLLDWAVPTSALEALASFCRVPIESLRRLDVQARAPKMERMELLQFPVRPSHAFRARHQRRRVRYGHCPMCLGAQPVPHVRWEWCIATRLRCPIHRIRIREGCGQCGENDPIHFAPPHPPDQRRAPLPQPATCWSCLARLDLHEEPIVHMSLTVTPEVEVAVVDAYRGALRRVVDHPQRLRNATHARFRRFVTDILALLSHGIEQAATPPESTRIARQDLVDLVGDLIRISTPSRDPKRRHACYVRSLVVWRTLLKLLTRRERQDLERLSQRWPAGPRGRLASALLGDLAGDSGSASGVPSRCRHARHARMIEAVYRLRFQKRRQTEGASQPPPPRQVA